MFPYNFENIKYNNKTITKVEITTILTIFFSAFLFRTSNCCLRLDFPFIDIFTKVWLAKKIMKFVGNNSDPNPQKKLSALSALYIKKNALVTTHTHTS